MTSKMILVTILSLAILATTTFGQKYTQASKPMPYKFEYGVRDEYEGTDFSQREESDGNSVQGQYQVQLPDGRRQTVQYTADHDNGYLANVGYEGQAQYPARQPNRYSHE